MLNYIWAGLIISSLLFALVSDFNDYRSDTYRNYDPLPITLVVPQGYDPEVRRLEVEIRIDQRLYQQFYDTEAMPAASYPGRLLQTADGRELRFGSGVTLPEPLATTREFSSTPDDELRGVVENIRVDADTLLTATVEFDPVHFVKLNAISEAAFQFAQTAVTIAIGLIGILALWLGLMQIAEKAGMIHLLVRAIQPVLRPLFPEIPKGHPAMGMIILNMSANVLGLGNAATPMGIKAMEELQKLNPSDDTATNPMCTFLVLNTSSVQLVPPATLVAVMGLQINQLFFSITLATLITTITGIVAVKLLQHSSMYRKTDPGNLTENPPSPETEDSN